MVMAGTVCVSAHAQDSSFGKRYQKNESDWNDKGEPIGCQRELPLDPVFDNVKRVLILVDVSPNYDAGDKEQASFPEPLRKANLESLLKEIYSHRYRKIDGMSIPNCYNAEGQEVIVMNFHDVKQREKINALIKRSGTLVAYFSFNTSHTKGVRTSHSAIALTHWRTDMPVFDQYRYIGNPLAIEIDSDPAVMTRNLHDYIRSHIRY
jgi:hypothetical protein